MCKDLTNKKIDKNNYRRLNDITQ